MKKEILHNLTSIDTFNIASWVVLIIAFLTLVWIFFYSFPILLKMASDPLHLIHAFQAVANKKTLKRINWIHAKISEKLKKWWLKIK